MSSFLGVNLADSQNSAPNRSGEMTTAIAVRYSSSDPHYENLDLLTAIFEEVTYGSFLHIHIGKGELWHTSQPRGSIKEGVAIIYNRDGKNPLQLALKLKRAVQMLRAMLRARGLDLVIADCTRNMEMTLCTLEDWNFNDLPRNFEKTAHCTIICFEVVFRQT